MSLETLTVFLTVVFVTCVTPGAGVLYTLHNAINYGPENAYLSPTGNAFGVLVMSLITAAGLGAIINSSPILFYGLQLIGCFLLIYFGYKSWIAPAIALNRKTAHFERKTDKKSRLKIFSNAALLQVSNPMLIVFLLSLLPQFINPKGDYMQQVLILIALFVLVCWLVHLVYSYSAAFAASHWMNERFSFWLNKISAALFWLIGISVIVHLVKNF